MMMEKEQAAPTNRRGRPRGSTKQKPAQDQLTLDGSLLSYLTAHAAETEAQGYSLQMFLRRIDIRTANIVEGKSLAQRFAETAGTSLHVATRVISGLTPLTSNMVVAIAKRLGCTTDQLLTGQEPAQPEVPSADESELLDLYRKADSLGKASMLFILSLDQLLISLPDDPRDRVTASLVSLHDAGAHELLSALPSQLGAYKARTGRDPVLHGEGMTIFTPVHEFCGVFGPEQRPLQKYLS